MKATKSSKSTRAFLWQRVALVIALSLLSVALAPPLAQTRAKAEAPDGGFGLEEPSVSETRPERSPAGAGPACTVTFLSNNGQGQSVSVEETAGNLALPLPSELGFTPPAGAQFVGWSEDASGASNVYAAHVQYPDNAAHDAVLESDVTLYAVWLLPGASDAGQSDACFYIRTDGVIPFSPHQSLATLFVPSDAGTQLKGSLRRPVAISNNIPLLKSNLAAVPSDEEIAAVCKAHKVPFDPETQEVVWYAALLRTAPGGQWNVNGVVKNKTAHLLLYYPNGGDGNVPNARSYEPGARVSVNTHVTPARVGHEFLGWSTDPAATEPEYPTIGTQTMTMPGVTTALYAVWRDTTPHPSLEVEKVLVGGPSNGTYYTLGEPVSYRVTVRNTGDVALGPVTLADPLADMPAIERLEPGASHVETYRYETTAEDVAAGQVENTVTATAKVVGHGSLAVDPASASVTVRTGELPQAYTYVVYAPAPQNGGTLSRDYTIIEMRSAEGLESVTATPGEGYRFVGWYKDDELVGTDETLDAEKAKAHLNRGRAVYGPTMFVAKFEPEEATEPEQPDEPEAPGQPDVPDVPTEPEKPVQSEKPTAPTTPAGSGAAGGAAASDETSSGVAASETNRHQSASSGAWPSASSDASDARPRSAKLAQTSDALLPSFGIGASVVFVAAAAGIVVVLCRDRFSKRR
ncbi:DUF7507 domain-containing protein [Xiamenia xianingshaonis]|uniref:Repeat protein (TIGR02543 family) n=1 Tax=Xiamenia xianingshaonis TaxID=2682776 RepID=A0ABX0IIW5_9ACTN|nr:InlB B-repeat-containing protein [Xiamenia xianingshaonis]NHM14784.1 hypothetical protein [Xiamenia xianingshaonis]